MMARVISLFVCFSVFICGAVFAGSLDLLGTLPGGVTVDGSISEWSGVAELITDDNSGEDDVSASGSDVEWIKAAYSSDQNQVYVLLKVADQVDTGILYRFFVNDDYDFAASVSMKQFDFAHDGFSWDVVTQGFNSNDPWDWYLINENGQIAVNGAYIEAAIDSSALGLPGSRVLFGQSRNSTTYQTYDEFGVGSTSWEWDWEPLVHYQPGQTIDLTWDLDPQDFVHLYLEPLEEGSWTPDAYTIAMNQPGVGSYSWTIPGTIPEGTYRVHFQTHDFTEEGWSGAFYIAQQFDNPFTRIPIPLNLYDNFNSGNIEGSKYTIQAEGASTAYNVENNQLRLNPSDSQWASLEFGLTDTSMDGVSGDVMLHNFTGSDAAAGFTFQFGDGYIAEILMIPSQDGTQVDLELIVEQNEAEIFSKIIENYCLLTNWANLAIVYNAGVVEFYADSVLIGLYPFEGAVPFAQASFLCDAEGGSAVGYIDNIYVIDTLPQVVFNADSDVITNQWLGLMNIGESYTLAGYGTFDGSFRSYSLIGAETVLGVDCLIMRIEGHGANPAVEYYDVRIAQDADGNIRVLKITGLDDAGSPVSWQAATVNDTPIFLPANPQVGQVYDFMGGEFHEVLGLNQTVSQMSTGAGPYSGCLHYSWNSGDGDIDESYYCPGIGVVKEVWNDSGSDGWERILDGKYSGGSGTQGDPYQIATKQDLLDLGANTDDYDKHFIVTADIDLDGETFTSAVIAPSATQTSWQGPAFEGTFDGDNHAISNLNINGGDFLGLFGRLGEFGVLRNIVLRDMIINGNKYLGGLCAVNGTDTSSGGNIEDCFASGSINGGYGSHGIGGLCGQVRSGGQVTNCCAQVTINTEAGANIHIGGLSGMVEASTVETSYADCTVLCGSNSSQIGGLFGASYSSTVLNCYTTGTVSVGAGSYDLGGAFGRFQLSTITNCYSSTVLSIADACYLIGGFSGGYSGSLAASCYWDVDTSGISASTGDGAVGKTTGEMQTQSTFTNWDFANTWQILGGNYPSLAWETVDSSSSGSWQLVSNMNTARDQFAGCVIGDEIFVFGGNGNPDQVNLRVGEKYDINTQTWSPIADHPRLESWNGVEEVCGIGWGGKFYVFGAWSYLTDLGYSGTANFNEMYNPATNSWTQLQQKPTAAAACRIALYNDEIYLFGGSYEDEGPGGGEPVFYTKVEAYNPATNTWRFVTDMPKNLLQPAVAVYGDSAYLIGGYDIVANEMNTEVMVYNFTSNTWTRNYCTAASGAARVYSYATQTPVVDGKAYLIGGIEGDFDTSWPSNKFTAFDIAAKTFETKPVLPMARSGHMVVTHNGIPYVIGGFSDEENLNRAKTSVYVYQAADDGTDPEGQPFEVPGDYWYGMIEADLTTQGVGTLSGEVLITPDSITFNYLEDSGDSVEQTLAIHDSSIDNDGWLNMDIEGEGLVHLIPGTNILASLNRSADQENDLSSYIFVKKAIGVTEADLVGEYAAFGHWLGVASSWSDAEIGIMQVYEDHTWVYFSEYTDGSYDFVGGTWSLNSADATVDIVIDGEGPALIQVGQGGVLMNYDLNSVEEDDLGFTFMLKKAFDRTYESIAGRYLFEEFRTDMYTKTPYTAWGVMNMNQDGTWTINETWSDGSTSSDNGVYLIGNDGTIYFYDPFYEVATEGVLSQDGQVIFVSFMGDGDEAGTGIGIRSSDCNENGIVDIIDLPGDTNGDGVVDFADFAIVAGRWLDGDCGMCGCGDCTFDSKVDFDDLSTVTSGWMVE